MISIVTLLPSILRIISIATNVGHRVVVFVRSERGTLLRIRTLVLLLHNMNMSEVVTGRSSPIFLNVLRNFIRP